MGHGRCIPIICFACNTAFVKCIYLKHRALAFQFEMKMLYIGFRQTVEDEDLMSSLKAKNENLESEVLRLRQKIEEQVKLHSSCTEAEMNALRTEKKRLEELVAGTRNERQQNAGDNSAEVVKELTTQKVELEEKLASLSAELEHYRLPVSEDAIAELSTLRDEKQRLDTLITYLENEVQQHKDTAHEQRIRALDLKHELREVQLMSLCLFCKYLFSYITSSCFMIYFVIFSTVKLNLIIFIN